MVSFRSRTDSSIGRSRWRPSSVQTAPGGVRMVLDGLYKPRTGRTGHSGRWMNHAPATLVALGLIYSTHQLLVVWIILVHFHLCSLLCRYTTLEVWAVWLPMRVCCGSRRGRCVLFTDILDSLTSPCLVYNTAMYTVCGRCSQYGRCMFIHWPVRPVRGLYGPVLDSL